MRPKSVRSVSLIVGWSQLHPAVEPIGAGRHSVVRAELDSMWSGLTRAMITGDTTAVGAFYADSAIVAETGGGTLRGKVAILVATAGGVFACCKYVESRFHPEVTELAGIMAFQFGTYRDVIQPTGQSPLAMYGRVSAVLGHDPTSVWRITRLVVIRDSSVTQSAPR